jgi:hypothetical protein
MDLIGSFRVSRRNLGFLVAKLTTVIALAGSGNRPVCPNWMMQRSRVPLFRRHDDDGGIALTSEYEKLTGNYDSKN